MTPPIVLTLGWPDAKLHSHNKGHWRTKATPTAKARELSYLFAKSILQTIAGRCRAEYAFFVPDNRRRDLTNMAQSCKAYVDGIVQAGTITDDSWQVLCEVRLRAEIDRLKPRVEITFFAIPDESTTISHEITSKTLTKRT